MKKLVYSAVLLSCLGFAIEFVKGMDKNPIKRKQQNHKDLSKKRKVAFAPKVAIRSFVAEECETEMEPRRRRIEEHRQIKENETKLLLLPVQDDTPLLNHLLYRYYDFNDIKGVEKCRDTTFNTDQETRKRIEKHRLEKENERKMLVASINDDSILLNYFLNK